MDGLDIRRPQCAGAQAAQSQINRRIEQCDIVRHHEVPPLSRQAVLRQDGTVDMQRVTVETYFKGAFRHLIAERDRPLPDLARPPSGGTAVGSVESISAVGSGAISCSEPASPQVNNPPTLRISVSDAHWLTYSR